MEIRRGNGPIWDISKDNLIDIINMSLSIREVFEKIGIDINQKYLKKYYRDFKSRIAFDNIDINGLINGKNKARLNTINKSQEDKKQYKDIKDIFSINHSVTTFKLRKLILENNLKPYKCELCGVNHNWNGKELTLQLDHINGVNSDNRLENLRFLCPNCHTQTSTYAGKNMNINSFKNVEIHKCKICDIVINSVSQNKNFCISCLYNPKYIEKRIELTTLKCCNCDNRISLNNKKGICSGCINRNNRKEFMKRVHGDDFVMPSKEELIKLIIKNNYTGVGKIFNISGNAVKKWCKSYNINLIEDIKIPRERYRYSKTTSGLKCVTLREKSYYVNIHYGGKTNYFGRFDTKFEAAKVADEKMIEIFGPDALTNKKLGLVDY